MKYRWQIAPAQPLLAETLARDTGTSPLLAQCLVNRGQHDPERIRRFLAPRLKHLADPFQLPNMEAAVKRLWRARDQGEALVIFGDYDVDGVTSTALLTDFLTTLGWKVHPYLPHRLDEGYGLSQDGVDNCLRQHPVTLLLAVDCGSTAVATILELREKGVEVIVLDHHQLTGDCPPAVALVNPQLTANTSGEGAFTELCSVGLAFKLAHALVKRGRQLGLSEFAACDIRGYLDLVALGTVADLVPLTGENRILVTAGLERLNQTHRPGLLALRAAAQITGGIGVYEVGFQLGPRLNAAGRLETANQSLQLLLARTSKEAEPLAKNLDARNRERQAIEKQIVADLVAKLRANFNPETDFAIVEGRQDFHLGVVGIVASRILQEFYRPTIILGGDGQAWRGSGRSIEGFDLAHALRECDALLLRHGGHSMAAGVTLKPEQVEAFRQRLNEIAKRTLSPEQLRPQLRLDAETPLAQLTPEVVTELEKLAPFGQQNPPVQLCVRHLTNARAPQRIGREQQHVKLWVASGRQTLEALWWGAAETQWPTGQFALAAVPQLNRYNGNVSVQLKVLDWQPET